MQTTAMAEMGIDNLMASVGDTPNEETRKAPNDPNALLLKEKANE